MSKDSNVVLIIEGDEKSRTEYENILETAGYIPMTTSNGYQGLETLTRNIGIIDVVLLSLSLSGIDGLEVLKAIKANPKKYGDIPVIVITSTTTKGIVKETLNIGACSYLLKSQIDEKGLVEELKKCI